MKKRKVKAVLAARAKLGLNSPLQPFYTPVCGEGNFLLAGDLAFLKTHLELLNHQFENTTAFRVGFFWTV